MSAVWPSPSTTTTSVTSETGKEMGQLLQSSTFLIETGCSDTLIWSKLLNVTNKLRCHKRSEGCLKPCEPVNRAFAELVHLCVQTPTHLEAALIASRGKEFETMAAELRGYAAEGEGHLEMHWAKRMATENCECHAECNQIPALCGLGNPHCRPNVPLEKFVYYGNYVDLTRLELGSLYCVLPEPPCRYSRLAFVGSGPMPLSSVEIARQSNHVREIHNIDCDAEAIALSRELCEIYSFGKRTGRRSCKFSFEHSDILDVTDLTRFDVVYLASLVGATPTEKGRVLRHLHRVMRNGAFLVVRTVRGLRQLLYPTVAMVDVASAGFKERLEVHPFGGSGVVNSVLIAVKADPQ